MPVPCATLPHMTTTRTRWTRRQAEARLPDDGDAGATAYVLAGEALPEAMLARIDDDDAGRLREAAAGSDTGAVLFVTDGGGAAGATLVLPPFPIEASAVHEGIDTAALRELLARPRAIGVFLLRLGGYSCGFFRGDALVDSKTGRRFVKNRHRKGGQSQRRFDRIREKQTHEHFGAACEAAARILLPYDREIDRVFTGGDRHTLQAFRKECDVLDRFGARLSSRVLAVPGDPRRDLLEAMPREAWGLEVWVVGRRENRGDVGSGK